ncbi:PopZ family protein [Martelella soudanensis]|uniref:PopZ family protein n=1 Tax=Martelella sp. NC20 TaxID=2740298 RepID=UPI001FF03958|nr:DUF2497 domain-containing protein [Martelella sp. NC20]
MRRIIDSGDDVGRSPRAAGPRDNAAAPRENRYGDHEPQRQQERDHDTREPPVADQDPEPIGDNDFISRRPAFTFDDDREQPRQADARQDSGLAEQETPETGQTPLAPEPQARQSVSPGPHPLEFDRQAVYPGTIGEVARQVREATGGAHQESDAGGEASEPTSHQDGLLSAGSEQRIGNALHALSDALDREGARRIEEIVVEELRPLLRDWIEEHMPSIVEEMVGKEIERMRNAKR